jgi:putative glutamine amidotransferase
MNVAFGGTLWQKGQDVPGMRDHREDKAQPLDVQYSPAHDIELVRGGYLHRLAGTDRVVVNSLHSQGVQSLGRNLEIEARAPDGLIEAFRVSDAPGFTLAVQWHPEWQVLKNPFSHAMFAAFGDAARARIQARK